MRAVLSDPDVIAEITKSGAEPISSTASELSALLQDDQQRWGGIIRELGLTKP